MIDTLKKTAVSAYYKIMPDASESYIHAHYTPPGDVVHLGVKLPDTLQNIEKVSWQWRVDKPPVGADERVRGKNDSGASVYLLFRRGIKTYILKYVFSTCVPQGTIISRSLPSPLNRMSSIVISTWRESEGNKWQIVTIDIKGDFMRAFGLKNCPRLSGVGLMSDGDGTQSEVVADYKQFMIWSE
jgi:anti-sigma factor ChrR (cupin superfamily)